MSMFSLGVSQESQLLQGCMRLSPPVAEDFFAGKLQSAVVTAWFAVYAAVSRTALYRFVELASADSEKADCVACAV